MDALLLVAFLAGFKHTDIVFGESSIRIFGNRAKVYVTSIIDQETGPDTTSRICPCDLIIRTKKMDDTLFSVMAISDDSLFEISTYPFRGQGPADTWKIDVDRDRMNESFLLEFRKTKGPEAGVLDTAIFHMKRDTSTCWAPFCLFRNW